MNKKLWCYYWTALPKEDDEDNKEHELRFQLRIPKDKMDWVRKNVGKHVSLEELEEIAE